MNGIGEVLRLKCHSASIDMVTSLTFGLSVKEIAAIELESNLIAVNIHLTTALGIEQCGSLHNLAAHSAVDDPVMKNAAIIYGVPRLCMIPQKIKSLLTAHIVSDEVINQKEWPLLIKVLPDSSNLPNKVLLKLNPTDFSQLPFYLKKIAPKMGKYNLANIEPRYSIIDFNGKHFLIIERQLPEIDTRLNSVELCN